MAPWPRHSVQDPNDKPPGILRSLAFGLLIGAACGAVEVSLRVSGSTDASVTRRGLALIQYASLWTGLLGGSTFAVAAAITRFGASKAWRSAREGTPAVMAGALISIGFLLAAPVFCGGDLAQKSGIIRGCVFLITLGCAMGSGWVVARRLSTRPAGPLAAFALKMWRPKLAAAAAALSLAATTYLAVHNQNDLVHAAAAPAPSEARVTSAAGAAGPDILMILVDTLRADVLSCYGGPVQTPNIDALAERGALFENITAPASWTLPSVASLFTSVYPWQHGCWDFGLSIDPEFETLAQRLQSAGYGCRGASGNPFVDEASGFGRGFDVFDVYTQEIESRLFVVRLLEATLELTGLFVDYDRSLVPWFEGWSLPWIGTRLTFYVQDGDINERMRDYAWPEDDRPTFLYAHYVGPHTPYLEHPLPLLKTHPALEPENVETLRARYDAEVAHTDAMIGELLESLAEVRNLDEMFIVLVSDHGEEFLEHGGLEHGHGVYEEVVHVPLILSGPGIPHGARIEGVAELLDVAPTLLDLIGIEPPSTFQGRSLAPLFDENPAFESGTAYCEANALSLTANGPTFGIVAGEWKVLRHRSPTGELISEEIYHLKSDPFEQNPLGVAAVPDEVESMRSKLAEYEAHPRVRSAAQTRALDMDALKALGYLGEEDE